MKRIKRILCLCTAIIFMASFTACNGKNAISTGKSDSTASSTDKGGSKKDKSEYAVTEYFDQVDMNEASKINSAYPMKYFNDQLYFIGEGTPCSAEYSLTTVSLSDLSVSKPQPASELYCVQDGEACISNGKIYSFTHDDEDSSTLSVGDSETGVIQSSEPSGDYCNSVCTDKNGNIYALSYDDITIYTPDLKQSELIDFKEITKDTSVANTYAYKFTVSPEGEIYIGFFDKGKQKVSVCKLNSSHTVEYISEDFSDMDGMLSGMYVASNGNIMVCSGQFTTYINEISPASGETVCRYELMDAEYIYGQSGKFNVVYSNTHGIFGYCFDDDSVTTLCSTDDSENMLSNVLIDGDKLRVVSQKNTGASYNLYISDLDGKIQKSIPVLNGSPFDFNTILTITPDSKIYYMSIVHGVDSTDGYAYETTSYSVYQVNSDDQSEKLFDIPTINADAMCGAFFADDKGNICISCSSHSESENTNTLYVYDTAGNLKSALPIDSDISFVSEAITLDGKINLMCSGKYDDCLVPFDSENIKLEAPVSLSKNINFTTICQGSDGYDFYYNNAIGVFGYKISSGEADELLSWINIDSDISTYKILVIDPQNIICNGYEINEDYSSDQKLFRFKKADEERLAQINSRQIIRLAGNNISNDDFPSAVKKFNKTNDEYRIVCEDYGKFSSYSSSTETYISGVDTLDADLISGKIPDILISDVDLDLSPYLTKNMFTDLGTFVAQDPDINGDDFLKNILDIYTYKDCLYELVPSFTATTLVSKASLAGDTPGWTYDDFFSFANNNPDIPAFFGTMQYELVNPFLSAYISEHTDISASACDFNNETFIKLLEFIKKYSTDEKEMSDYQSNSENILKNNDALLAIKNFSSLSDFHNFQDGYTGENVTIKGFPSDSTISKLIYPVFGFSISEKSTVKDGAWQFIRQYFLDEYQNSIFSEQGDNRYVYGTWPVKKSTIEKYIDGKFTSQRDSGDIWNEGSFIWEENSERQIGTVTEETKEKFLSYMEAPSAAFTYESKIMKIISDETTAFFSDGVTAAETAAAIQNKVQLYLYELG